MQEVYGVAIEGLRDLQAIDKLPDEIVKAARMAVNATVRRSQATAARSMERQVKFPSGYITGQAGRLRITKLASAHDLEGKVTGRDRPTSLARFIKGTPRLPGSGAPRQAGVMVEVKPGIARRMPGAFAIRLRNSNIGLALRTKDGRPPSAGAKLIGKGLYLLYGPSIDQVFVETRNLIRPDMEEYMEREFLRLVDLKL